jgi:hypothetical protein
MERRGFGSFIREWGRSSSSLVISLYITEIYIKKSIHVLFSMENVVIQLHVLKSINAN